MSTDAVRDAIAAGLVGLLPRFVSVPAGDLGAGVDLVCFDDLTATMAETDPASTQSLAQDNYHRLITPAGSLADDLDYGTDITEDLSGGLTQRDLLALQGRVETELLKDDRNAEVSCTVTILSLLPCKLSYAVTCTPADAALTPFKLVIVVDAEGAWIEAVL